MLTLRRDQINTMVLANRPLLIQDIEDYLSEFRPHIVAAYPRPYLRWVINDAVDIALGLGIDDVRMLRVFVRLRWDIAPGFYKQPDLAAVLADRARSPVERFATLATDAYADAWTDAERYDGPQEWRERFWVDEA